MRQDIRWKQRFQNFEKAFLFLQKATERPSLDDLQAAGLIKSFEFTFELAWKTLKDYIEEMGIALRFPREVIKHAFQTNLIENGELWLEMLEHRNELTHTYDEIQTKKAVAKIRERYFPALRQVYEALKMSHERFGLTNEELDKIILILKAFPEVEQGAIFGSRALGTFKRGSDIDIALFGKNLEQEIMKIAYQLNEELALPYFFDVVDYYNLTQPELKEHIDRVGVKFYHK